MSALGLGALALLAALAATALLLRASQRRRPGRIAQYAPPPGLGIVTAAVLTRTERRAVAAELVHLAVRGNVRFLAPDAAGSSLRVELLDGPALDAQQRALLVAVFGAPRGQKRGRKRPRRAIGRDAKLGRAVSGVVDAEIARLKATGGVLLDASWPAVLIRCLAVAALGLYALTLIWAPSLPVALLGGAGAVGLAAVAVLAPPPRMRRFSAASFAVRDHLAGLRDYIALAEADRLRFLQSPAGALTRPVDTPEGRLEALVLNERLLPFAVLFGLEREWARQLQTERRELTASGVLNAIDGAQPLGFLGDLGLDLPLVELLDGLRSLDVDLSLLAGIELPDIDLGALSLDL
ncbi:DUF2207 domain-containing protein [Microterricola viridarii]|uniref:Predicted membrane protein n=1 Tax=Microterricola viridarii TaxID=412690 RepID=A0A1H1U7M1_9MICO|nr:DUF2207 domain-containing protein [Microterricola viridarii]SDS68498.1 Predicted membrane protein [Microterricola viridarii]